MQVYLNNAATGYPKPETVVEAIAANVRNLPGDSGRGMGSGMDPIRGARRKLAAFFGSVSPERVIFTSGATEALNMVIHGCPPPVHHIVSTVTEHNSVLRPLHKRAERDGTEITLLPCDSTGKVDPSLLDKALRPDTGLVVLNHASNVCGTIQDLEAFYGICEGRRVPLLLDASQTAGVLPLDCTAMPRAAVVFTGHKGMLGPSGVGGVVVGESFPISPWMTGGTGSHSDRTDMPAEWPFYLEAGTPNAPGIAGLGAAMDFLSGPGYAERLRRKSTLARKLAFSVAGLHGATVHGHPSDEGSMGIVSFTVKGWSVDEIGMVLAESFGIRVRTGLHCAPLIHRHLGSDPAGTVRASLSVFNTLDDVEALVSALSSMAKAAA